MRKITPQEEFWKGSFGNEYIARNNDTNLIASNIALFSDVLKHTQKVNSVIEFGSNIGLNLTAIKALVPSVELTGIEINEEAFKYLNSLDYVIAVNCSMYDYNSTKTYDFVFTKGVLIHQNPAMLPKAYEMLYKFSNKYIFIAEYYNSSPVEINYRCNSEMLFKRDFAGEILDKYHDLSLNNYGFVYRRDNLFPQDDLTWFLLEKRYL